MALMVEVGTAETCRGACRYADAKCVEPGGVGRSITVSMPVIAER